MENWLNILIGVIAIVATIAGARNKKNETEKKRRDVSAPKPFIPSEDLFGELRRAMNGEDEEDEEVENEMAPPSVQTAYLGHAVVDEAPAPTMVVDEIVQPMTSFNDDDLTKPYQAAVNEKKKFELDAKQMIIFSAILKPKFEEN